MKKYILFVFCMMFSSCVIVPAATTAQKESFNNSVPTCSDNCDEMWAAAQAWMSRNLTMKIQIATSSMLETYNTTGDSCLSEEFAATVNKEPIGNSSYKIVINVRSTCFNDGNSIKKQIDFNEYVGKFSK